MARKKKIGMKYKDLVHGEVYYQKWEDEKYGCITIFDKNGDEKYIAEANPDDEDDQDTYHTDGTSKDIPTLRLATAFEKKWLLLCIEAGEIVPKPTDVITNEYPIY